MDSEVHLDGQTEYSGKIKNWPRHVGTFGNVEGEGVFRLFVSRCAQFCAHHQPLRSSTKCDDDESNPLIRRSLSQLIDDRSNCRTLLILRAATATNQKVGSSNLSGRAIPVDFSPVSRANWMSKLSSAASIC